MAGMWCFKVKQHTLGNKMVAGEHNKKPALSNNHAIATFLGA